MGNYLEMAKKIRRIAAEVEGDLPAAEAKETPEEIRKYFPLLNKMKTRAELGKLKFLLDNYTLRRNDSTLAKLIDEAEEAEVDVMDFFKQLRWLLMNKSNFPAVQLLRRILDYAMSEGYNKLVRVLGNKLMRVTFSKSKE